MTLRELESRMIDDQEAPTTFKEFHSQVKTACDKMDAIICSCNQNVHEASKFYNVEIARGNKPLVLTPTQIETIQSNAQMILLDEKENTARMTTQDLFETCSQLNISHHDSIIIPFALLPTEMLEQVTSEVQLLGKSEIYAALEDKINFFVEDIDKEKCPIQDDESVASEESTEGVDTSSKLGVKVFERIKRRFYTILARSDPLLTLHDLEYCSEYAIRLSVSSVLANIEVATSSILKFIFGNLSENAVIYTSRYSITCHVGIRQWSKNYYGIGIAVEAIGGYLNWDTPVTDYRRDKKLDCTLLQGFPLKREGVANDIFYDCSDILPSSELFEFVSTEKSQSTFTFRFPLPFELRTKKLSSVVSSARKINTFRSKMVLDQRIYGWGGNLSNCLGVSSNEAYPKFPSTPTRIPCPTEIIFSPLFPTERISTIACSPNHTLLLSSLGIIYSCGDGSDGQLGHGSFDACFNFQPIESLLKSNKITFITDISAGGDSFGGHSAAIDQNGNLYTWGKRTACGQLSKADQIKGIEDQKSVLIPMPVEQFGSESCRVIKVSCGGGFTLVLTNDNDHEDTLKNRVFVFGTNQNGRLGLGVPRTKNNDPFPRKTLRQYQFLPKVIQFFDDKGILDISAGVNHALATDSMGNLYAWGSNKCGQCGQLPFFIDDSGEVIAQEEVWSPRSIRPFHESAKERAFAQLICTGNSHSLVLDTDGRVWTWGGGSIRNLGVLGHGDVYFRGGLGGPISAKTLFRDHNSTRFGLFGKLSSHTPIWFTPRIVKALRGINVKKVSCGAEHSAVVTDSGKVYLWGNVENLVNRTEVLDTQERVTTSIPLQPTSQWCPYLLDTLVSDIFCAGDHTFIISEGDILSHSFGRICDHPENNFNPELHMFPFFDCRLIVSGRAILCHRAIVAQRSKVLCQMIEDEIVSAKPNNVVQLLLADLQYEVAMCMIEYIYTNNVVLPVTDSLTIVKDLRIAAEQFELKCLFHQCNDTIESSTSSRGFDVFKYTSESYHDPLPTYFLSKDLNDLMVSQKWADVRLIVSEKIIMVHKFVLAARSNYFRKIFESSTIVDDKFSIELPSSYLSIIRIIQYIYNGIVSDISEASLREDLLNAHLYQINNLKSYCECEIEVSTNNSIPLFELAHRTDSFILQERIISHLIHAFSRESFARRLFSTIIKTYPTYANELIMKIMERESLRTIYPNLSVVENMFNNKLFEDRDLLSVMLNEAKVTLEKKVKAMRKQQKNAQQLLGMRSEDPFQWKNVAVFVALLLLFKIFQDININGSLVYTANAVVLLGCVFGLYFQDYK